MKHIEVLGIEFDNITIGEAVKRSLTAMDEDSRDYVLVLDSQEILLSRKSRQLMAMLRSALLVLPGDAGVFAAAQLLGMPLNYKMSAMDYSSALLARLGELSGRVYVLAATKGLAERAADDMSARFPGLAVVGAEQAESESWESLKKSIDQAQPDLLILSMDFYEQMQLIKLFGKELDAGLILGIGRAMDASVQRRREKHLLRRLINDPGRVTKAPRLILAALKFRMFG